MTVYEVAGRRLAIHDREEWQTPSRPVTGPKPSPDLVHWFVVHWPGAAATWKPPLDTATHLRWAQDMYLLDPNRGYSYGYGHVIGVNPIDWNTDPVITDIWEVRGFDIRIASNDGDLGEFGNMTNPNFNGRSTSGQIMASTTYPATDDQIEQMRYLVAIADAVYGETLTVIPHLTSDATSCPHPYITSKIPLIATRPTTPEPPAPPPPSSSLEATMLAAIGKTTDGAHLAQFVFHGPIFTMGETDAHDVSTAEVFGRGGGRAYNIVDQTVVSWSTTSAGSWGAVKASKTVAQVRSLMGE